MQINLRSATAWYIQIFFLLFEDRMQKKLNCCCPRGSANTKGDTHRISHRKVCVGRSPSAVPCPGQGPRGSSNCIENKQCCGAVGVCSGGEGCGVHFCATSSCHILESHCLPMLEGCSSKAGGTVCLVTAGARPRMGTGLSLEQPWPPQPLLHRSLLGFCPTQLLP